MTENENECRIAFTALKSERGRIGPMSVYKAIKEIMDEAELNAYQTDFSQDSLLVKDHFWNVAMGSLKELLSDHKNCRLEVSNWFALQGIIA